MLKITFSILIVLTVITNTYAQSEKMYLNESGEKVDDVKRATSYIVYSSSDNDTLFYAKQFSLDDILLFSGSYKDKSHNIPNGTFIYYNIESEKMELNYQNGVFDTIKYKRMVYVKEKGRYVNGVKQGKWINYFSNGNVEMEVNYSYDKREGPYTLYHNRLASLNSCDKNNTGNLTQAAIRGFFKDDSQHGKWYNFSYAGNLQKRYSYDLGNLLSEDVDVEAINRTKRRAKPGYDMIDYFNKKLKKSGQGESKYNRLRAKFTLTKEGKIADLAFEHIVNPELDIALIEILTNSPAWKSNKSAFHIDMFIEYVVIFGGMNVNTIEYIDCEASE